MNEEEFKKLLESLSGPPLSESEKARIRGQLSAFMLDHPAHVPLAIRLSDAVSDRLGNLFGSRRAQIVLSSLAVIFVAGGGTAYAAQQALPGDPLYAIKVNITEPLQGALATTPQAKAQWNADLAARRLSEAEKLAAENKLTPQTVSQITNGLDQATTQFDQSVAQLATSSQSVATAAALDSNMEATLAANTQVLGEIADAVPAQAPSIEPIVSRVIGRVEAIGADRVHLDVAAAQADAQAARVAAEEQIQAVQSQIAAATTSPALATSTATKAAIDAVSQGKQHLDTGDYARALETIQAGAVAAQEAQLNLTIANQLKGLGIDLQISGSSTAATSSDQNASSTINLQATTTAKHAHRLQINL